MHPALEIEEVRNSIAQFLSSTSIIRCASCCHQWYESFIPYIWCTVIYDKVPLPQLEKNKHRVQHLVFQYRNHLRPNIQGYSKLRHLTFKGPSFYPLGSYEWEDLSRIINNHCSTLEHITIDDNSRITFLPHMSDAILACPKLKSLTLEGMIECEPLPVRFWETCRNVEKLVIDRSLFPKGGQDIVILVQNLTFIDCSARPGAPSFLGSYPKLRHLQWRPQYKSELVGRFPIADLNSAILNGQLPILESINIHGDGIMDEDIAITLNSVQQLTSLRVPDSEFGVQSCQALARHLSSIKTLDLSGLDNSWAIQTILSTMTALENLKVGRIQYMEIVNGSAWTAINIRNLEIDFLMQDEPDDIREEHRGIVYSRLASLINLNTLSIRYQRDIKHSNRISRFLDLRLESGLKTLSTLKKLAAINYEETLQQMEEEEIQWIVENWPSMRRMTGKFTQDPSKFYKMKRILNNHGILVYD